MTAVQFHAATEEILKNYWRIKAANTLYRSTPNLTVGNLEYTGVPSVGAVLNSFNRESVGNAISALQGFIQQRLPRDLFLALISEFEGRIGTKLTALGESDGGTLGALQIRIQSRISVPQALIEEMNEIRVRRNVMIHHGDLANAEYVTAVAAISARSISFVKLAAVGDNVCPTDSYLAYAADVLVRYSNSVG